MSAVSTAVDAQVQQLTERCLSHRVLIGFSGGLDSTVLLHAAVQHPDVTPVAIHINHQLHPDSGDWQRWCGQLCEAWQVAFLPHSVTVSNKGNLEAQARAVRYERFRQSLSAQGSLWLAHHQEDQLETLLMRTLSGRGFYGIPQSRMLGLGYLVRPLLAVSKKAMQAYAEHYGLEWIEDPGNQDMSLTRNTIRHHLLPRLRAARSQGVVFDSQNIAKLGERAAQLSMATRRRFSAEQRLPAAAIMALPMLARVAALRCLLQGHGEFKVSDKQLHTFLLQHADQQVGSPRSAGAKAASVWGRTGGLSAYGPWIYYRAVRLNTSTGASSWEQQQTWVSLPGTLSLPDGVLEIKAADSDRAGALAPGDFYAPSRVLVQLRVGGERILGGPRQGSTAYFHRSVKKLLQAAKLPPWQRQHYPLLVVADPQAGLAANDVGGLALETPPPDSTTPYIVCVPGIEGVWQGAAAPVTIIRSRSQENCKFWQVRWIPH